MKCMNNFRMKLNTVKFLFFISYSSKRGVTTGGNNFKPIWNSINSITMAHPNLMFCANIPKTIEEWARYFNINKCTPKFPFVRFFNLTPHLFAHSLLTVTNSKNRNTHIKNCFRSSRSINIINRIGTSR